MSVKGTIKKVLKRLKQWILGDSLQLMGRMASWQVRSREVLTFLWDAEFRVSSQWGEDGIIDWLIERANIPPAAQSFIEFGVATYREANTRFLLQNRNWRGLIMDSSPAVVAAVKEDGLAWAHALTTHVAFITRENINDLILRSGFGGEIGLLSIDLDGNDYWIWEAIDVVRPILCVCEYNAVFGDILPVSIPYDPRFHRTNLHYSNLYFGTSISALRSLAVRKGYRFVGTNSAGNNAFFVREDYARQFIDKSLQHIQALPSKFRESRDKSGNLNYIGEIERLKHISALPLVDVVTGEAVTLDDLRSAYSKEWLELMMGAVDD
jgi:hypothetical protein